MNKRIYHVIFLIVMIFIFNSNIKSLTYGGCEYSQVSRLKSYVSNINVSYDYYVENNNVYFNVTINNIVPGIYFVDSVTDKTYNYNDAIDGEITIKGYSNSNGNYKFYSALSECYGIKLGNKYYSFPTYNRYYVSDICSQNRTHSLCQKWVKITYSYDELETKINEYNKSKLEKEEKTETPIVYNKTVLDTIVEFYVKYYYIILIGIIVICITAMIINRRKNKFDI